MPGRKPSAKTGRYGTPMTIQSSGKPAKVYRAKREWESKTCTRCGLHLKAGQEIKFTKDGISKNHPAPRHLRCPQRPITVTRMPDM